MTTTATYALPTNKIEALGQARDLLLTDGWITGHFRCDTGGHCASGAIRAVCGGLPHLDDVRVPQGPGHAPYAEATFALATAINPDWRADFIANWEGCGDDIEDADETDYLEWAEDTIFTFNDGRVKTDEGRDQVLAKFDEAARS